MPSESDRPVGIGSGAQVPELDPSDVRRVIEAALAEDVGTGDITSLAVIPEDLRFHGVMRARHGMVIAGLPVAAEVFRTVEPSVRFHALVSDGDAVAEGAILAEIGGPARGLLAAERTALNLLQTLSGIATATRQFVDMIRDTSCTLLDTRKTIPGLRNLSKYATRCGGARNHRRGLFDAILIKDNHIAVCGSIRAAVARAHESVDRANPPILIEVECDTLDQVAEAADSIVDMILLDNMNPDQLRQAVALVAGRAKTEASGGVTLETIRAIAESGVDYVSVGRITQSAPAVDIGLDWV